MQISTGNIPKIACGRLYSNLQINCEIVDLNSWFLVAICKHKLSLFYTPINKCTMYIFVHV